MQQRLWFSCIVCSLLLHTLVCTCMPSHWLHTNYASSALPSSVKADDWVHYTMSGMTHTMNHIMIPALFPAISTGAMIDAIDMGISGFGVFLIMVAVVPTEAQRISALNLAGRLNPYTAPNDLSPFHDIPIPPPR